MSEDTTTYAYDIIGNAILAIVFALVICYWMHKVSMRWSSSTKQQPIPIFAVGNWLVTIFLTIQLLYMHCYGIPMNY